MEKIEITFKGIPGNDQEKALEVAASLVRQIAAAEANLQTARKAAEMAIGVRKQCDIELAQARNLYAEARESLLRAASSHAVEAARVAGVQLDHLRVAMHEAERAEQKCVSTRSSLRECMNVHKGLMARLAQVLPDLRPVDFEQAARRAEELASHALAVLQDEAR